MESLYKARKVRLSNCQGKYLFAEDDKQSVCQSRRGDCANAVWEVKQVVVNKTLKLRFRSCYKCYLTGSDRPFLLGMTGKKVFQTNPTKSDDLCDWLPEKYGDLVMLSTRNGSVLRSNGGAPPWRNTITHDVPLLLAGTVDVYWAVHVVE